MEGHKKLGSLTTKFSKLLLTNQFAAATGRYFFSIGVTWALPGSRDAHSELLNDSTTVAALRDFQFSHGLVQVRSCRSIRTNSGKCISSLHALPGITPERELCSIVVQPHSAAIGRYSCIASPSPSPSPSSSDSRLSFAAFSASSTSSLGTSSCLPLVGPSRADIQVISSSKSLSLESSWAT